MRFIKVFLFVNLLASLTFAQNEELHLSDTAWYLSNPAFNLTNINFGTKTLKSGESYALKIELKNEGEKSIKLKSFKDIGSGKDCWDFFASLDEKKSSCEIDKVLAKSESCKFVVNLKPDSEFDPINRSFRVSYQEASEGNIFTKLIDKIFHDNPEVFQEFKVDGNLLVALDKKLLGKPLSHYGVDDSIPTPPPMPGQSSASVIPDPPPMPDSNVKETEYPKIIFADATESDPYFPYIKRATEKESAQYNLYPQIVLDQVPEYARSSSTYFIPWTLEIPGKGEKELQTLGEIVPDRIYDKNTGKRYIKLYHGTTDDLLNLFSKGEEVIRFDVATTTALGMGFYLAANLNEAKSYACSRLKQRIKTDPDLKGLVLVVGIEDLPFIKGKYSPGVKISDENTGESFDPEIYFRRNSRMTNQFVFFKNTHPYMKVFEVVSLPRNFRRAAGLDEKDGMASDQNLKNDQTTQDKTTCPY